MTQPPFDPSREVRFDLGRGQLTLGGSAPRVMVPTDALVELCRSAGADAAKNFGRRIGTEAGRRAASRLVGGPDKASLEAVLEHLGGDLALLGLGSLGIERWGRALVMTVAESPLGTEGDSLLASVVEGALQRAMSRDASVVALAREDGVLRLLVVGAATAQKVATWLSTGMKWSEALAKLNATGGTKS